MQILDFSEFARRRADRGQANAPANAGHAAFALDRWALLHASGPNQDEQPIKTDVEAVQPDADFWSDLQFRFAYPTHRMRRH